MSDDAKKELKKLVDMMIRNQERVVSIGNDVFRYKIVQASHNPDSAVALLNFFDRIAFLVLIMPPAMNCE